jgi:hypothetical protein
MSRRSDAPAKINGASWRYLFEQGGCRPRGANFWQLATSEEKAKQALAKAAKTKKALRKDDGQVVAYDLISLDDAAARLPVRFTTPRGEARPASTQSSWMARKIFSPLLC